MTDKSTLELAQDLLLELRGLDALDAIGRLRMALEAQHENGRMAGYERGERRGLEWAAKHFEAMKNASYSRSDTVSVAFATDAENEIRALMEETK